MANKQSASAASAEERKAAVFEEVLETLSSNGLSFSQLMLYVFDPVYKQGVVRWNEFFKHQGLATQVLNLWVSNQNSPSARQEVGTWAEDYVAEAMRDEAQGITESKKLQTADTAIDNDYVTNFSMLSMGTYFQTAARISMKVLAAFATSPRNLKSGLVQRAGKHFTIITAAALSLLGEFSHKNNFSRRIMGLYLYATGAQRQTISVMSHLGISESYQNLIHSSELSSPACSKSSASQCEASRGLPLQTGLFAASYDNINLVFRAAEQIMGRTDSQENGTCTTIFPLWKAAPPPLSIDDILLTATESELMDKCLRHCILRIIVEHGGEHFKRFCDDVQNAQPVTAEKIELHRTQLHPLPAWNIDESTIIGNAEVADAIYTELQVKGLSHWNWIVKILCGDQLSIARLRSLLDIRAGHEGGYSGFGWGMWMPGLLHGKIVDMHGFFVTHWGVPHRGTRNPGSLFFHNTVLHHSPILLTSLPPFRVCHDLVFVSLYARVLHCLLLVSGKTLLAECADSITSFCSIGRIFENASLLFRDALISREFTDSIKAGDSGRVVLVLKVLALSFRGNGRSKYAYEMMHLIHNLTHVWPKPIRNIVLNNWLVNPTGKLFSWVEVDLMQEHMNFWIKTIYQAHGSAASWEWLGMVAPCTKHAPTDLSTDIELLMGSLAEHEVYEIKGRVFADGDGSPTPDVITDGIQQITDNTSNPLTEYNAALLKLQARRRLLPLVSTWSDVPESTPEATSNPPGSSMPFVLPPADVEMSDVDDETSENGSHGSVDPDEELLSAFEHTMDEVDEPTLTRDNADDVALDMDGGDTGFIFNSQLDMDTELDLAGFIADDADDMDYVDSY
ncbi:hypothetical protein B0H14DRAFT_3084033 [Mycena olivaceomarginata]|nr:hypothetical protein B0H14DRAFT_3084033 [Mycena olivaceomarginata]